MIRSLSCTIFLISLCLLFSCSPARRIGKDAQRTVLNDPALQTAHVGISIFDPQIGQYLYNYQGDKYFVPASNTKLPTCYAAMKYLGDSLVAGYIGTGPGGLKVSDVFLRPAGDPTFLLPEFGYQPLLRELRQRIPSKALFVVLDDVQPEPWGSGWSWNDYQASYMAERNVLPVWGNVMSIRLKDSASRMQTDPAYPGQKNYRPFTTGSGYLDSLLFKRSRSFNDPQPKVSFKRLRMDQNDYVADHTQRPFESQDLPFVTENIFTALGVLGDTLHCAATWVRPSKDPTRFAYWPENGDIGTLYIYTWDTIHSQPTDSLLRPMMHRSDNFFAEQSLLMVSNRVLGVMSDERIIDTLLKTDLKDLPQRPRWVDGSGLSRYNLFTPQDFVAILNKMRTEFGMERVKNILATGNEGTLVNYYKAEHGAIFAKTGTLSGVVALSGYLYTRKGKLLLFSVLVNNHNGSATAVRRAVESFIESLWRSQ